MVSVPANIRKCINSGSLAAVDMAADFFDLFFPRCCLACTGPLVKGEQTICTGCRSELPRTHYHHFDEENPIQRRLSGRIPIRHGWAFLKFRKQGIVQKLLHHLKYNNHPEVGVILGRIYGHELLTAGFASAFDLIVPVPLHPSRKRKRGYNQSAAFAEGLSSSLGVPWNETVSIRMIKTETQTRRSKQERWENVKDVFAVEKSSVINLRILLVDDVITTGATIEACGRNIVHSGCRELSIACIAEAQ